MKKNCIIILAALILASCAPTNTSKEVEQTPTVVATQEVQAVPQSGKTINLSMRSPKTLNPLLNEDFTVDRILKLIFEPLVSIDENLKPVPNLLEKFEFLETGNGVTLTLKDNLKWHDGQPITTLDIAFSIDTLYDASEISIYKQNIKNLSSYHIIDEKTISISYFGPYMGNSYNLNFPIIPQHYYSGKADDLSALGNGVYKFVSFEDIHSMNLEKNNEYKDSVALIDKAKVMIIPDIETEMNSFDQGVINVISSNVFDWGKYRGSKETNITEFTTSYYDYIGFNFNNLAIKDIAVRKAMSYLVPKDDIVQTVYLGHALKTETPVNPTSWLYENNVAGYVFDDKEAEKILVDAGYEKSETGDLEKKIDGQVAKLSFKILVNSENLERVKIAEILKEKFEIVGIKTEIVQVGFEEFKAKLISKDFDMFVGGYNLSTIPDLSFFLHSTNIEAGTNSFSYKNEIMDSKLAKVFSSFTESSLKDTMSDLQLYIGDEIPCISLVFRKSAVITDKVIYGDVNPTLDNIFNNINEWFMFEEEVVPKP